MCGRRPRAGSGTASRGCGTVSLRGRNTMLSRIERAQRRCDIDDLVALAQALRVSPLALLQGIRAA
ncbi:helix-turn-helix domain-containing protein [Streptomyces sp. B21-105]|uniref:helix-turn-helix domain-containing protein n=1 Tax=Streptomyces sp. B21-105 TaxID=3039417 RepID=UPI003FA6DFAD